MKLYIAYGAAADQTTALRLQALGVVNGLTVYVPPSFTRTDPFATIDPSSEAALESADVVLGIVTSSMSESCRQELNRAKFVGRKTIVLADPVMAPQLEAVFPGNIVTINPSDPAQAEQGIVQFLKKSEMDQAGRTALLALGTLALGLLLFAPQGR